MKRIALFLSAICLLGQVALADVLERVAPQQAGLCPTRLENADRIINAAVENNEIPGAVFAIVRNGKMAYLKAYGYRSVFPKKAPMTTSTIFDMASCSKSMSTAVCVNILIDRGYIRLQDNVSMYIPGFKGWVSADGKQKSAITIEHLLTHSSGIPAYVGVAYMKERYGANANADSLLNYIANCRRDFKPGTNFQYSCLNFITLQHIIQKVSGMSLRDFAKENIFKPLGMNHTDYLPCHYDEKSGLWVNDEEIAIQDADHPIAPTEKQGKDRKVCLLGQTHDPLARELNLGISGNAGIFTTADDIALLCAALQNGGELNGTRILSPLAVKAMRTVPCEEKELGRSLGWDVFSDYASNNGNLLPFGTFGHTGYTGTSIVIDPTTNTSIILLTNRAHPDDKGGVVRLRSLVANAVAGAIIDVRPQFSKEAKASTEKYFPYYYTRYLEFMNQPAITSNDIVMLGDSQTEGGKDWGKQLGWKNVVNRGIIGDEINGIYDRLHQILPGKPKKIYLLCGVNDVSHHLTTDEIVKRMDRVIDRIQRESPDTKLYLESCLPINESFNRYKNLTGKTDQIPEINARYEELAKAKGITFINIYPKFCEEGTNVLRKDITTDGLHFNEKGYEIWRKVLKATK